MVVAWRLEDEGRGGQPSAIVCGVVAILPAGVARDVGRGCRDRESEVKRRSP